MISLGLGMSISSHALLSEAVGDMGTWGNSDGHSLYLIPRHF
jgi:hypothetical protein